jgi:2'-5' RNA ligase
VHESYRTFIAIEFPREIRARVAAHITRLRQARPEAVASWNREDNLHLTLKFLGNVPLEKIEELSHAVAAAASRFQPFALSVAGCGKFPTRGKPNVLWIGLDDPSGTLSQLHHDLEDNCAKVGFAREARAFHPHLTIARLRKPSGAREIAELHTAQSFPAVSFNVSEVVVFRSELLKTSARHTALFRHQLAAESST